MNPPAEVLETWLEEHLGPCENPALIDVGAFHGDFATMMMDKTSFKQAHLFEPNPQNFKYLEGRFGQTRTITLHRLAIGDHSGRVNFFCNSDQATGSVLPYLGPEPAMEKLSVPQSSLDAWWLQSTKPSIGLIKIDTQGSDLNVLCGAEKMIARFRPWIVVELIFVPLYHGQARPGALLSWAESHNYRMAGMFNEHRASTGCIAFADAVLAPVEKLTDGNQHFVMRSPIEPLQQQIFDLHCICDERLREMQAKQEELVQLQAALSQARAALTEAHTECKNLRATADERLGELQAKQAVIGELKLACDEREALIHRLQVRCVT
jgi:FkbM family methyltransferase